MLTVASIMTRAPVAVAPDCPLERARALMREHGVHHLPVVAGEHLVGVLSEHDVLEPTRVEGPGRSAVRHGPAVEVDARMSRSLDTVRPGESVQRAARRLFERRIGCLPVVEHGRVVGMLSESDLLRLFVETCVTIGHDPWIDPPIVRLMGRDVLSVSPETNVFEALERCRSAGIRHLPVLTGFQLVGIVSDRDLLPAAVPDNGARSVRDVMSRDFVALAGAARPLSEAAACMLRHGFHAVLVLAEGSTELRGLVTSTDVLEALMRIDEVLLESAWRTRMTLAEGRGET